VAASRAELLLMLDQDDLIADGYVHAMAAALTRSPLVFGRLEHDRLNPAWLADALRASPDQERARVLLRPERTAEPTSVRVGIGCALGMRRELFDRLGGFATDVGCTDDVDLCLRAHALGVELVRTDDAVVHYRLRRSLPALFRQRYGYGASWAALYKRHRAAGMPRPGVGRVACELVRAVRQLASASRCARARGVAGLGFTLGRMAGSRRHRVLYAF
jgi:GT2 family glycosyltransferase